jgi:hypothetical protein
VALHDVLNLREMAADEIVQRRESGYDLTAIDAADDPAAVLRQLERTERVPDWTTHR